MDHSNGVGEPVSKTSRARETLEDLDKQLDRFQSAQTLDEARRCWEECLIIIERLWNRIEGAYRNSARWGGLSGTYQRHRASDPLLAYVKMARDSLEHGVEPVMQTEPGGFAINPIDRSKPTRIENLSMQGGVVRIGGMTNAQFVAIAPSLKLVAVHNRGGSRNPPTSHLGKPIDLGNPLVLLLAARGYYVKALDVLESALGT
ncbi:hypothetical protein [Stenotrophomonas panacihumi]|uniref:hypothetical protein n=1 Tax=Stenotrophomonas panacihumi TaxID=676599 RepID=UPI001F29CA64|nr:hypothetical protein [Stenotrophomonas panacihumi]